MHTQEQLLIFGKVNDSGHENLQTNLRMNRKRRSEVHQYTTDRGISDKTDNQENIKAQIFPSL